MSEDKDIRGELYCIYTNLAAGQKYHNNGSCFDELCDIVIGDETNYPDLGPTQYKETVVNQLYRIDPCLREQDLEHDDAKLKETMQSQSCVLVNEWRKSYLPWMAKQANQPVVLSPPELSWTEGARQLYRSFVRFLTG